MTDCIFCKIADGTIPAEKVYEDKGYIAFLDVAPANKGHSLIIPKKHCRLADAPDEILKNMIIIARKISNALMSFSDATNLIINNGKAAGQVIEHLHMHVIPRHNENNFKMSWPNKRYEDDANLYAERIKALLK